MTKEKFEELVNEGIRAIPKRFLEKLDNVDIVIENEPSPEQLRKLKMRKGSIIFGLYEGVPQTKRGNYGQVLPDKITIFQKPIERISRSENEIKEIVKNTVWHEIAHHFGIDERKVRELEYKRKIKK
jgi:predicted Zn-dependent protease with MMP-like domain